PVVAFAVAFDRRRILRGHRRRQVGIGGRRGVAGGFARLPARRGGGIGRDLAPGRFRHAGGVDLVVDDRLRRRGRRGGGRGRRRRGVGCRRGRGGGALVVPTAGGQEQGAGGGEQDGGGRHGEPRARNGIAMMWPPRLCAA